MRKAADVVFMVAAIALTATVLARYVLSAKPDAALEVNTEHIRLSDITPSVRTAFVYISPECHYCQSSVPFYQNLVGRATNTNAGFAVRFVSASRHADFSAYLKRNGLPPSQVAQVAVPNIVRGTPTLLVVDPAGWVLAGWLGRLSRSQERQALALLAQGGPSNPTRSGR